ncbi:MAG: hypothetical protein ACR2MC_12790 [Actinomycetota bacterium]
MIKFRSTTLDYFSLLPSEDDMISEPSTQLLSFVHTKPEYADVKIAFGVGIPWCCAFRRLGVIQMRFLLPLTD